MALTEEWRRRIERWETAIWASCYRPLGEIPMEGFTTFQQLSAEEARNGGFKPLPPGTAWGAKWEYAWFRGELVLPQESAGQRIVVKLDTGGESLVWISGSIAGSRDWAHREITLSTSAVPGTRYEILLEAYAGHGPTPEGGGPVIHGTPSVPEPGPTQVTVAASTFGTWDEDIYQLALDFSTLYKMRSRLDPYSLRLVEIDQGLMDATLIIDMELEPDKRRETVRAGRARLKPLLECVNGSTSPLMFAFGHAHLDIMWLWPHAETERKIARTIANQLSLMEEYPEYKYLQSQAHLLRVLQTLYPEVYGRVKTMAKRGQFLVDGGMWVEADTNISGGESLIRQFIHGKRYFREEFGVESQVLWLPDVFGYSGALPQIMRGCGIKGFSTQKINWTYNGGDHFPLNTFVWEGIDGSEIVAHVFNDYGTFPSPDNVQQRWIERNQKNNINAMIMAYGWGDGGGGPSRDHVEFLHRLENLEGVPRVSSASPADFFQYLEEGGKPKDRYVGELYFQAHRGTYTTQAETKRGNRRSELALREAEMWGVAARVLKGFDFTARTLEEAWKTVLLNQFHDILPGSSIQRVYKEVKVAHAGVIATAQKTAESAARALVNTGDSSAVTVFNSLPWKRTALVALPKASADAATQSLDGQLLAEVAVPACGWTTATPGTVSKSGSVSRAAATSNSLENEFLRVVFDARGEITSLVDKESGRELAAGPCNVFHLYKDVPVWFDAWDIDSMTTRVPVELSGEAKLELVAAGPLVAQFRLTLPLLDSTLTQVISLRRGSHRIDFQTTVDWRESHKLLKVSFPVTIHANEAIHEIQFGHIRRPNHYSRPFDADRFEVSNHKWSALAEENRGVAVLNDCKYGLNVLGNTMSLTLLRSTLSPDMTADKGIQTFAYALYAWNGSLADCDVVKEAYDLNCPPLVIPGAGGEQSLFSLDAPNIVIEAVKPAEDSSDGIVLRLYESKRTATRCTLLTTLPVQSAVETDMLEKTVVHELPVSSGKIKLEFRPFEIKTICLKI